MFDIIISCKSQNPWILSECLASIYSLDPSPNNITLLFYHYVPSYDAIFDIHETRHLDILKCNNPKTSLNALKLLTLKNSVANNILLLDDDTVIRDTDLLDNLNILLQTHRILSISEKYAAVCFGTKWWNAHVGDEIFNSQILAYGFDDVHFYNVLKYQVKEQLCQVDPYLVTHTRQNILPANDILQCNLDWVCQKWNLIPPKTPPNKLVYNHEWFQKEIQ